MITLKNIIKILYGRLDINANANVFIIIEKKENTILEFSQNFANVLYKTKV